MTLIKDDNNFAVQVLAPIENKNDITTLNVADENILAVGLTEAVGVKINNQNPQITWPVAFYGIAPNVRTLNFASATDVIVMGR